MNKHRTHPVAPGRPSDPLQSRPPSALPFGGHLIRFVRCEFVRKTKCLAVFVVIDPPTRLSSPDIVIGYGQVEDEARKDAFARAQARIENHQLNFQRRSADGLQARREPLSEIAKQEHRV